MQNQFARWSLVAMICVPVSVAAAQELTLPTTPIEPAPQLSPEIKRRIEQALQRARDREKQARESQPQSGAGGDMILGDIMEVIRQRGSVLDGSVLDPKIGDPLEPPATGDVAAAPAVYEVAEDLLRASRLLAALPPDSQRQQLVRSMRHQATQLLIEAIANEQP